MRNAIPVGGSKFVQASQVATVSSVPIVGTETDIEVPTGCVAIVTGVTVLTPSSNNLAAVLAVDGTAAGVSANPTSLFNFVSQIEVPAGRHRISINFQGSTAAGTASATSISWVIVRRDRR